MVKEINAQVWLENEYKEKEEKFQEVLFEKIMVNDDEEEEEIKLKGEITIDGQDIPTLSELKIINLQEAAGITKLIIKNCPDIETIDIYDNPITDIEGLGELTKLKELNCGNTKIGEIDINKNIELMDLRFHDNDQEIKIKGFKNIIKKLCVWNSINGIAFPWEQIVEEDLKEIARELGIGEEEIEGKEVEEIKEIVKKRAEQLRKNETEIKEKLPDLISKENEVDTEKLEELAQLNENKGDVTKVIKDLKWKVKKLESHIRAKEGKKAVENLLAQIEVKIN